MISSDNTSQQTGPGPHGKGLAVLQDTWIIQGNTPNTPNKSIDIWMERLRIYGSVLNQSRGICGKLEVTAIQSLKGADMQFYHGYKIYKAK